MSRRPLPSLGALAALAVAVASSAPSAARADDKPAAPSTPGSPATAGAAERAREPRTPVPLDGIAAVVDDAVIFRSDVLARTKPFLEKLSKDPTKRRGELASMKEQLLSRMIDEILVAKDAAKLGITVNDADVSNGLDSVAKSNGVTRKQLEAEVKRIGLSVPDYEDEIRKQVLEGRWLMLRAAARVDRKKATDPAAFEQELMKLREIILVQLRAHAYIEMR